MKGRIVWVRMVYEDRNGKVVRRIAKDNLATNEWADVVFNEPDEYKIDNYARFVMFPLEEDD